MIVRDDAPQLKRQIAAWLAVTAEDPPLVGLDEKEAARRAAELLAAILDNRTRPDSLDLGNEMKQVLSVLVRQLKESILDSQQRLHQADAVYQFIHRLAWPVDAFDEQRDLLLECAEIGWGAVGMDLALLTKQRLSLLDAWGPSIYEGTLSGQLETLLGSTTRDLRSRTLDRGITGRVCAILCARGDDDPLKTLEVSSAAYVRLTTAGCKGSLLDEVEHLTCLFALMAGTACRILGRLTDAEKWFVVAESHSNASLTSEPLRAKLTYARATALFQGSRFAKALTLLPTCLDTFSRLEMRLEFAKARLTLAMVLNALGEWAKALEILREISASQAVQESSSLHARVLSYSAACLTGLADYDAAEEVCSRVVPLLEGRHHSLASVELKFALADLLKGTGRKFAALSLYRGILRDYSRLGMATCAAQMRLVVAETALELGRDREAEHEILAALPTIEEQGMVPEGLAAVALLKESVRRRKTDPNALRELREHLQATQK